MSSIADAEYRRAKQRVVDNDRRELVREFVNTYGLEDGLSRLSRRTGQPLALYQSIAHGMRLGGKRRRGRKR